MLREKECEPDRRSSVHARESERVRVRMSMRACCRERNVCASVSIFLFLLSHHNRQEDNHLKLYECLHCQYQSSLYIIFFVVVVSWN